MDQTLLVVLALIAVALIFDYINGFHDAANSIATVVSTRVLTPGQAVIWAAAFNFLAAFGFGTAVAKTVGSGMVDLTVVTSAVIFGGLLGAIVWDLITWYFGLPTSSSHALVGGYAGAAMAKAGFERPHAVRLDQDADLHRPGAADGHGARPAAFGDHAVDVPRTSRRAASITGSAGCSWCRRRCTAWATAATTRRRRWGSSPACC